jgi:hypothetical protein
LVSAVSYVDLERTGFGEPETTGWDYYKTQVIENRTGAGENYTVKIKAYYGTGSESDLELNLINLTDEWSSHGLTWGDELSGLGSEIGLCYDGTSDDFYMGFADITYELNQSVIVKINATGDIVASRFYDGKCYKNLFIANGGKLYGVESAGSLHNSTIDELNKTDLDILDTVITFSMSNYSRSFALTKINDTVLCLVGGYGAATEDSFYMKVDLATELYTMYSAGDGAIFNIYKNGDYGYIDHYGEHYGNKKIHFPTWTTSAMGSQPATDFDLIPLFLYNGKVLHAGGGDGGMTDDQKAYWYTVSTESWAQLSPYPNKDVNPSLWGGFFFPDQNKAMVFSGANRYYNTPASQWVYDAATNSWDDITGRFTEIYGNRLGGVDSMYGYGTIGNNETFGVQPCGFLSDGYYRFIAPFQYRWYDGGEKRILAPIFGKILANSTFNFGDGGNHTVYLKNHARTDFADVRFEDESENALNYWMMRKVDGHHAEFYLRVAEDLSSSSQTILIRYGNSGAATTSDMDSTIVFGEVWDNSTLNTDRWVSVDGNPIYTINNVSQFLEITDMDGNNWWTGKGFHSRTDLVYPNQYIVINPYTGTAVKLWFHDSGTSAAFGIFFIIDDSTPWSSSERGVAYYEVYDNWDQSCAYGRAVGVGENGDWDDGALYPTFPVYTRWEILRLSGNIAIKLDGIERVNETNSQTPDRVHLGIKRYATYPFISVRLFPFIIRSYVDPEPIHESWGDEGETLPLYPANITVSHLGVNYGIGLYNSTNGLIYNGTADAGGTANLTIPLSYRHSTFEATFRVYDENGSFLYSKWFEDVAGGDAYLIKEEMNILAAAIIGLFVLIPVFLGVIVFLRRKR